MKRAASRLFPILAALLLPSLPAAAQLGCEQLVASAQAGIALRDQGATLKQVLAETEKGDLRERFKPEELEMIRRAVRLTYTGEVSLYELAGSCSDAKSGAAGR